MTSRVRVSAHSRPSPPLYPHFNWPSDFWPCVKSCLVGGSDKYHTCIKPQYHQGVLLKQEPEFTLNQWVECSLMVQETWVQSQVASYQRLYKWYLIPPCLALSNIRYVSRVKWSNPEKGVAPSPTPRCRNYWKGSLLVTFNYGCQLYFTHSRTFWKFIQPSTR